MENVVKTPSMSFGEALKTCFKKYVTFSGRARRSEFWWFSVLNILLTIASYAVVWWKMAKIDEVQAQVAEVMFDEEKMAALTAQAESLDTTFYVLMGVIIIISLLLLLPSLGVAVRRLHDTGKSGWWLLAMIIPIVNFVIAILLLIYYLKDSDPNPNKYGPSPKYIVKNTAE